MQRRAELARALINRPLVLLMDEPFRGLDAMTRQLMQEYLLKLFEGSGQTILFVTSEIDEAILLADKLVLLSRSPASTKLELAVDLPRPRDASVFSSPRYAELKSNVLSMLYDEALEAFASGSRVAADLVEAFELRHGVEFAMMKKAFEVTVILLMLGIVGGVSAGPDEKPLTPIIAQLVAEPEAFAGKAVTIYGLVIESRPSRKEFMLQDVSQHPLKIVGSEKLMAAVGDQLTVIGIFKWDGKSPYIAANLLIPTRVFGGGGCC